MDRLDWRAEFAAEARAERPDLARLCLLLGAELDPELVPELNPDLTPEAGRAALDAAEIELDRLAGMLPHGRRGARAWADALAELLGGRLDFRGAPADYQRLESSLLHEVLRRRRGLPILLSVVWIEVARRAGAPVYGVALPGHFVVGFGEAGTGTGAGAAGAAGGGSGSGSGGAGPDGGGPVLVDPFAGGRVLTGADAELLVAGATGAQLTGVGVDPSLLEPADPLGIVQRILNNVRAWAAARPERTDVALRAVELSLLLPSHPARLRYEWAQLLVQRGDFLRGAAAMEEYAEVVAGVEPVAAEAIRVRARATRALLN
ncbi:transglutaminase-like domain-containing protein [Streptomyces sp. NPDC050504]|uniref:transglutaminase-like domain-containing protein n=1 Tax=Streptomyces sp. NPDC050504 TaxID=3365618 RepID=UPI00379CBAF6